MPSRTAVDLGLGLTGHATQAALAGGILAEIDLAAPAPARSTEVTVLARRAIVVKIDGVLARAAPLSHGLTFFDWLPVRLPDDQNSEPVLGLDAL
jgi:hypothetical protein